MREFIYEKIIISKKEFLLVANPLDRYLESHKKIEFIKTPSQGSKKEWKGYTSVWELINDSLFLKEFYGLVKDVGLVDMDYLFPKQSSVKATWFTGDLKIPIGKELDRDLYPIIDFLSTKNLEIGIIEGNISKIFYSKFTIKTDYIYDIPF
jgi:hypothetical protein